MDLVSTLTNTQFLTAVLAAVAAAAVVFSIGATFFSGGSQIRQRIKRVALEREKMRAMEMARLRGSADPEQGTRTIRHAQGKDYMKNVVEQAPGIVELLGEAQLQDIVGGAERRRARRRIAADRAPLGLRGIDAPGLAYAVPLDLP